MKNIITFILLVSVCIIGYLFYLNRCSECSTIQTPVDDIFFTVRDNENKILIAGIGHKNIFVSNPITGELHKFETSPWNGVEKAKPLSSFQTSQRTANAFVDQKFPGLIELDASNRILSVDNITRQCWVICPSEPLNPCGAGQTITKKDGTLGCPPIPDQCGITAFVPTDSNGTSNEFEIDPGAILEKFCPMPIPEPFIKDRKKNVWPRASSTLISCNQ